MFSLSQANASSSLAANSASTLSTFSGSSGYSGGSPYCSVPPTPSAFTKTASAGSGVAMATKQTPPASPHCVRHVAVGNGKKERSAAPGGTTPPAKSKSRFVLNLNAGFPLIKSKSQESQLGVRVQHDLPNYTFDPTSANTATFISQQVNYATARLAERLHLLLTVLAQLIHCTNSTSLKYPVDCRTLQSSCCTFLDKNVYVIVCSENLKFRIFP